MMENGMIRVSQKPRIRRIAFATAAGVMGFVLASGAAVPQGAEAAEAATIATQRSVGPLVLTNDQKPERSRSSLTFVIGDKLRISLFERYGTHPGGTSEPSAISTLVEFPEITGEYTVQQDGAVFLPLLGETAVAGRSQEEVQGDILERFSRMQAGTIEASVQLVEREPVYVTGLVAGAGTYKHVPGMTVLHALALAGSLPGAQADIWRQFDVGRERERLSKSEERLVQLHARVALLEAEIVGREPSLPDALITLMGREQASALVEQMAQLRELESGRVESEINAFSEVVAALESERDVIREALVAGEETLRDRSTRMEAMREMLARGVTTEINVNQARNDLTVAQERWNDTRMALARVERAIAQARQEKMRVSIDEELERATEVSRLKVSIIEEQVTRSAISQVLGGITDNIASATAIGPAEYRVFRRAADGVVELTAEELTPLEPGDVLKVITFGGSEELSVSWRNSQ
jgi:polysaccharide biosynthesis/export protein ExoF